MGVSPRSGGSKSPSDFAGWVVARSFDDTWESTESEHHLLHFLSEIGLSEESGKSERSAYFILRQPK